MNKYVVVYTIGPVQSFIASARKTEDLWSGSYLLSYLIERGLEVVLNNRQTDLVFPAVTKHDIDLNNMDHTDVASHPNRFTFVYTGLEKSLKELMIDIDTNIKKSLNEIASYAIEKEFPTDDLFQQIKPKADKQISHLLEIYWAASKITDGHFSKAKNNAEKEIGSLKNFKHFPQDEMLGLPCTVCQHRSALALEDFDQNDDINTLREVYQKTWRNLNEREKRNEFLCAVCLTKRHTRKYFEQQFTKSNIFDHFPSTVDIGPKDAHYFAILQLDGDDMGSYFTDADKEEYANISKRLAHFSKDLVPKIIHKYDGKLVYSGGDDVLAFLPVNKALLAANELRESFSSDRVLGRKATISGGLAIGHKRNPLRFLLEEVRSLEEKAKSFKIDTEQLKQTKNALSISVQSRGGEKIEAVLPWDNKQINFTTLLHEVSIALNEDLSDSFIYQLSETFKPLIKDYQTIVEVAQVKTEFMRLMNRSVKPHRKPLSQNIVKNLFELYEIQQSTLGFFYLLKMLTFINRREGVFI